MLLLTLTDLPTVKTFFKCMPYNISCRTYILMNQFFSRLWPEYVRSRVRDTYIYFGSSVALTAVSAALVFRSPTMFNLVTKNSWMVGTFST